MMIEGLHESASTNEARDLLDPEFINGNMKSNQAKSIDTYLSRLEQPSNYYLNKLYSLILNSDQLLDQNC